MTRQLTLAEKENLFAQLRGQGSRDITSYHQNGHITFSPPAARRDVRREIYSIVYSAGRAVTRAEIAETLRLRKNTPWLLMHIEQLVVDGYLIRSEQPLSNGMKMYFYEVAR